MRVLMLLSTLCLPAACGKSAVNNTADAALPDTASVTMPTKYGEFENGDYRAKFAADFSKKLEITKGSDHFFLPVDYQWKLEEAMKQAGAGREVPDTVFRQTDNAVLAQSLKRLFDEWADHTLSDSDAKLYRGPYIQQLYRHYRNLRTLEVLPDQPERKGAGDIEKLVNDRMELNQKAWQLTSNSPFFGIKKDPASAGPLDSPLMPLVQRLSEELIGQCSNRGSDDFKVFYLGKIQTAVLDMILPGMYLDAMRGRLTQAGLSPEKMGLSENDFGNDLKRAFTRRSVFFGTNGVGYASDISERRIMEIVSAKFKELGRMDHPLELYKHQ